MHFMNEVRTRTGLWPDGLREEKYDRDSLEKTVLFRFYDRTTGLRLLTFAWPLWEPLRIVFSGVSGSAILVIFTFPRNDTFASRVTPLSVILEATAEKMNGLGETFYIARGGF